MKSSKRSPLVPGAPWRLRIFFFNDTPTTEIYTLSLHDALPIWRGQVELVQRVVHQAGQVRIADADPQAVTDRATNNGPTGAEHADRPHVHGDPAVRLGPDLPGAGPGRDRERRARGQPVPQQVA